MSNQKNIIGVIAGNFDVIHPGYIEMFDECKERCEILWVLLHTDPSIERPNKLKPILSVKERIKTLKSLRQIDKISTYTLESELETLIKEINPDIRFLGTEYKEIKYTGHKLNIPIHYISRNHDWSKTKFKTLIAESIK